MINAGMFSAMNKAEQDELAATQGMSAEELQQLLADNPELAEKLSGAFGASLMKPLDYQGDNVGPYNVHVNNPMRKAISGLSQGLNAGMQMRGQNALLDALRNKGGTGPMGNAQPGAMAPMNAYEDVSPGAGNPTDWSASANASPLATPPAASPTLANAQQTMGAKPISTPGIPQAPGMGQPPTSAAGMSPAQPPQPGEPGYEQWRKRQKMGGLLT